MKCKVCGKRFSLKAENRNEIIKCPHGVKALVEDVVIYEAFDCTKCGCQNIVNVREGLPTMEYNPQEQRRWLDEADN